MSTLSAKELTAPSSKPAPRTGADVVVETLEARGTTHVFGVSGAKIDKVFDRLLDSNIPDYFWTVTARLKSCPDTKQKKTQRGFLRETSYASIQKM
jgi:hypothetical protein